jgi:formylglycine-generating enzyme required for sulfatase activity
MMKMTTRLSFALAIGSLLAGVALAGTLEPPGPPAPTMATQQQLWDAVKPPGCFNNNPTGLRFVDCGNGTVQDTQTGLIWLKNANCLPVGGSDWAAASRRVAKLADGTADGTACGLSDGSKAGMWRLPTIEEWQALSYAYPSSCNPSLPAASGTGCYSTSPWATGVQSDGYWSSSANVIFPIDAWGVYLGNGSVGNFVRTFTFYVWPVRGGP